MTKIDCDDAYFHTYRNFHCTPSPDDVLYIEIFDIDDIVRNDILGTVTVPISSLTEEEHTFHINPEKYPDFTISLRCKFLNKTVPSRKQFFLIRHGESKWNLAQRTADVTSMAAFDHGLTARGVMQALRLNMRWKRALPECFTSTANKDSVVPAANDSNTDSADAPYLPFLRNADMTFASPLTRAVQTALCCLWNHKSIARGAEQAEKRSMILRGNIREVKNVAGFDTVGKVYGPKIQKRVFSEFKSVWSSVDIEGCENVDNTVEDSAIDAPQDGENLYDAEVKPESPKEEESDASSDAENDTDAAAPEKPEKDVVLTVNDAAPSDAASPNSPSEAYAGEANGEMSPNVTSDTEEVIGDVAPELASVMDVDLDHNDVNSPWWTPPRTFDSKDNIKERVMDTLDNIRYGPAEVPVLVGHSLFWRALYGAVCQHSAQFIAEKPELSAKMKKFKLDNGVMMFLDVDFATGVPVILDAHLMFNGGFHP